MGQNGQWCWGDLNIENNLNPKKQRIRTVTPTEPVAAFVDVSQHSFYTPETSSCEVFSASCWYLHFLGI